MDPLRVAYEKEDYSLIHDLIGDDESTVKSGFYTYLDPYLFKMYRSPTIDLPAEDIVQYMSDENFYSFFILALRDSKNKKGVCDRFLKLAPPSQQQRIQTLRDLYDVPFSEKKLEYWIIGSDYINFMMNKGTISDKAQEKDAIRAKDLFKRINFTLSHSLLVYRGIGGKEIEDSFNNNEAYVSQCFSSTSISPFVAQEFTGFECCFLEVTLPPGTDVLFIPSHEYEIVLKPGKFVKIGESTTIIEGAILSKDLESSCIISLNKDKTMGLRRVKLYKTIFLQSSDEPSFVYVKD